MGQFMKLCFICFDYPPGPHGGIGVFTQTLSRALVQNGHEVRVIGVYPRSYPAADRENDRGVQIWRLRQSDTRFGWIFARYRLFRHVAIWARNREIDLLEGPDFGGVFAGWLPLPIPVIVRTHGCATFNAHMMNVPPNPRTRYLERLTYKRADSWIAISRYTGVMTKKILRLPTDPGAIIYNAVDCRDEPPPFQFRTKNKVVFTGSLVERKGVLSLLRAWPLIVENFPEAELHLYGKDSFTYDRVSMRERLWGMLPGEIKSTVHFHGHVDHEKILAALSTARVAVFPSFAEGFALAPIEAMSTGCPTIFTQVGTGPELITHRETGLLVNPAAPTSIAGAVLEVLINDHLAQRYSLAGFQAVKDTFNLKRAVSLNEIFYLDTVRGFRT